MRKYRRSLERFPVEGLQVIHMALDAGAEPLDAFYTESLFAGNEAPALLERCREAGAKCHHVAPNVMRSLSERDDPQGLVVTFRLFGAAPGGFCPPTGSLVVVVDRLQDPGNLGTIIRTADAVGAYGVALVEPCVDPFDPKTVRGTMGSLFNLPPLQTEDAAGLFSMLKGRGLRIVGADAARGVPFGEGLLDGGVALVLGNEARGLSDDVRPHVDAWACLPMVGRAESLNVAVAGGVLMYGWLRARPNQSR